MKNILSVLLKVCVSGFILYVLFSKIDMALFWRTAISVKPYVIVLIALFFVCTQAVSTYRWSIVLKKDMEVKYFKLLSIYFIGMFFNNFLPTMVGGDLVKGIFFTGTLRGGTCPLHPCSWTGILVLPRSWC